MHHQTNIRYYIGKVSRFSLEIFVALVLGWECEVGHLLPICCCFCNQVNLCIDDSYGNVICFLICISDSRSLGSDEI